LFIHRALDPYPKASTPIIRYVGPGPGQPGQVARAAWRYQHAIAILERALVEEPTSHQAVHQLGKALTAYAKLLRAARHDAKAAGIEARIAELKRARPATSSAGITGGD
jgi:hypothetical protein